MASRRSSGLVGAARNIGRQAHAIHLGQIFAGLFDNHVGDQHAVGAGCGGIVGKAAEAVAQDRD